MSDGALDDLILRLHASPLEPQTWPSILESVCVLIGAQGAMAMRHGRKGLEWGVPVNYDVSALREYDAHWRQHDEWLLGAIRNCRIRSGVVSRSDDMVERRVFLRSAFRNEFLRRPDMDHVMNVCVAEADPPRELGPGAVGFYRGFGQEAFSDADAALLGRLAPHLVLATRNLWNARMLNLSDRLRTRALDSLNAAVLGVGPGGRLVFANQCAEQHARCGRWLSLSGSHVSSGRSLRNRHAFGEVLARLDMGKGSTVLLVDARTGENAMMSAIPLSPGSRSWTDALDASGVVWIVPSRLESPPLARIGWLFGLTRAEQRLLACLLEGRDLRTAADELGLSVHTVRGQLKSIFRRTGRSTQSQVLALVHRFATINNAQHPD